jgi:hypothetical protein
MILRQNGKDIVRAEALPQDTTNWKLEEVSKPGVIPDMCEYDPKDVIRDWNLNFNTGNAVMNIAMTELGSGGDDIERLEKAVQYLQYEIDYLKRFRSNS